MVGMVQKKYHGQNVNTHTWKPIAKNKVTTFVLSIHGKRAYA
jgi:hypothetical protein